MTNVLIPTDFSVSSLELINLAAQSMPGKMNVYLFHAFDMPDSLADAMIRTGGNGHYSLVTEELRLRCKQIKTANANISNISFRIMYGTTVSAFQNFAEANEINTIILPEEYFFIPVVRDSVNPERMLKKSGITVIRSLNNRKTGSSLTNAERPIHSKAGKMAL